ncbi:TetR family transcriptional regulator [Nocardia sp. NPDC055029]
MGSPQHSEKGPARRAPGRPRGSIASQTEATRERIIEVATELFAADGFHATSVSTIGTRTQLQPGALYYHIKSKEDLLWEILRSYTEKALAGARAVVAIDADPVEKLGRLIDAHLDTITRHRLEVIIQSRDADALTPEHAAQLQELRRDVQHCWETVLGEGETTGKLMQGNRIVANGLLGMVNAAAVWYRPDHGDTPQKIARELRKMIINGLAPRT